MQGAVKDYVTPPRKGELGGCVTTVLTSSLNVGVSTKRTGSSNNDSSILQVEGPIAMARPSRIPHSN